MIGISYAHLPSGRIIVKTNFIIPTIPKRKNNCKYKPICTLFSDNSYTCTHTGGSYCGSYRKLSGKPAKKDYLIEMPQ